MVYNISIITKKISYLKIRYPPVVGSSTALATCETSQVLLAGVLGGFSQGSPVFAHLLIGPSHMR